VDIVEFCITLPPS